MIPQYGGTLGLRVETHIEVNETLRSTIYKVLTQTIRRSGVGGLHGLARHARNVGLLASFTGSSSAVDSIPG
jgi:hypothetical protein